MSERWPGPGSWDPQRRVCHTRVKHNQNMSHQVCHKKCHFGLISTGPGGQQMFQIILSKYLLCPMALKLIIKDLRKLSYGYAVHSIQFTLSLYYLIKILQGPFLAISLHMLHFQARLTETTPTQV